MDETTLKGMDADELQELVKKRRGRHTRPRIRSRGLISAASEW